MATKQNKKSMQCNDLDEMILFQYGIHNFKWQRNHIADGKNISNLQMSLFAISSFATVKKNILPI